MILYTVVPLDIVFGHSHAGGMENARVEMEYQGVHVQAELLSGNLFRISRIISSSPGDYLNPKLQPGTIVEMGK